MEASVPTGTMHTVALVIAWVVIGTGLVQNLIHLAQLVLVAGAVVLRRPEPSVGRLWRLYGDVAPPISLIVPAFNEEKTIVDSVRSLLSLEYSSFEVIVVNDGSQDRTLEVLLESFGLEATSRAFRQAVPHSPMRGLYASPRQHSLLVVDKERGGKADALNAAINMSRCALVGAIDADTVLEPGALLRVVRPFVDDPARTVAVGGTVRIANGCRVDSGRVVEVALPRNLLALFQTVEYFRTFLMARPACSHLNVLTTISGAFGVFRRRSLIEVGGYTRTTVSEDLEIVVKLHRHMLAKGVDYRIVCIEQPACWTQAPETLRGLGRQRARWQRGALETFFAHAGVLVSARRGRFAVLGMGQLLLTDVIGPVVEVLGYLSIPLFWMLGLLDTAYLLAFLGVTVAFGIFLSISAVMLEEIEGGSLARTRDLLIVALAAVAENFGYRQLCNLWRLRGWWQFLRRRRDWGVLTRRAFRQR